MKRRRIAEILHLLCRTWSTASMAVVFQHIRFAEPPPVHAPHELVTSLTPEANSAGRQTPKRETSGYGMKSVPTQRHADISPTHHLCLTDRLPERCELSLSLSLSLSLFSSYCQHTVVLAAKDLENKGHLVRRKFRHQFPS